MQGRSRLDEFAAVLGEVVRVATDEHVDVVLVSGDIFEHRTAHADSERLVFETLARLAAARIPVVAIPGNHDAADRWHAFAPLLDPLGVRVTPFVRRASEGAIVEVPSGDGSERAVVACVPFVPMQKLTTAASLFAGPEQAMRDYSDGMGTIFANLEHSFHADAVNVLMAHVYMAEVNVASGGGENEVTIAPDYAVSHARLPGTATYIALGHVHRPQAVPGAAAPARYAGSLLQLDFGERGQQKSVVIVEAAAGKPARVRDVPLTSGRALRDLSGTIDELRTQVGSVGDDWLRVTVRTDGPVPGIAEEVRSFLPNAIIVKPEHPLLEAEEVREAVLSLAPREQFLRFYRQKHGAEPSEPILAAFEEARAAVTDGAS
jgi:DNA repair protein SbcD/Mre11